MALSDLWETIKTFFLRTPKENPNLCPRCGRLFFIYKNTTIQEHSRNIKTYYYCQNIYCDFAYKITMEGRPLK